MFLYSNIETSIMCQRQKFVAVKKAKYRGTATSENAKNRGNVAVKIRNIAALSRSKHEISRFCRGNICKILRFGRGETHSFYENL